MASPGPAEVLSADASDFVAVSARDTGGVPLLTPTDLCTLFHVPTDQHAAILDAERRKPHPEVPPNERVAGTAA
jgi:hypothetical protein